MISNFKRPISVCGAICWASPGISNRRLEMDRSSNVCLRGVMSSAG